MNRVGSLRVKGEKKVHLHTFSIWVFRKPIWVLKIAIWVFKIAIWVFKIAIWVFKIPNGDFPARKGDSTTANSQQELIYFSELNVVRHPIEPSGTS